MTNRFEEIAVGQQQIVKDGEIVEAKDRVLSRNEIEIDTHSFFDYESGSNIIKMELIDTEDGWHVLSESQISLVSLPLEKFTFQKLLFRNQAFLENVQSYMHSLTHI